MPTHNRQQLLEEAVGSVQKQSFSAWEAIIVDDASAPPAVCMPAPRSAQPIRVLRHDSSQGGAAAKNTGAAVATGDYLAFLDDDDLYHPEYLARAVEVLDGDEGLDVLFMGVGWFGANAVQSGKAHDESVLRILSSAESAPAAPNVFWWRAYDLLSALLRGVPMPFQRPVVRRRVFERIGAYRKDCLLWDCEWALRAAIGARCALLNEPLYLQRAEGQGLFSRRDRQRGHIESAAEMVLDLYRALPPDAPDIVRELLRGAASRNAEDLAFFLSGNGDLLGALRASWRAQLIEPSLGRLKLPVASMVRSIRGMVRQT